MTFPIHYGHLSIGSGKTEVHLYYGHLMGMLCVAIVGGRAHIGALTVAIKRHEVCLNRTLRIPGHRDDVISSEAGGILTKSLRYPVVIIAGIHQESPTPDQIAAIVRNSRLLCRRLRGRLYKHRINRV